LRLDEGADPGAVHLVRPEVAEVRFKVLVPAVAVAVRGAVGVLARVEPGAGQLSKRRHPADIRWKPSATMCDLGHHLRQHAFRILGGREPAAAGPLPVLPPSDLPESALLLAHAAVAPLATPTLRHGRASARSSASVSNTRSASARVTWRPGCSACIRSA